MHGSNSQAYPWVGKQRELTSTEAHHCSHFMMADAKGLVVGGGGGGAALVLDADLQHGRSLRSSTFEVGAVYKLGPS